MKTIGELLIQATDFLKEKGIENPRRTTEQLLAHTLDMERNELYLQHDRPLKEGEVAPFRALVAKKLDHTPTEYLIGHVDFMGVRIRLTPDVLIPRPETELLLEKVSAGGVVWDICCGSGCLGLAYKKRFPNAHVILSDISEKALAVAKKNAEPFDVECRHGDLLAPFVGEKANVILCNPPYITSGEYATLSLGVMCEPKEALVSGPTGLEFYKRFASELPPFLAPGARLFFEVGTGQGEDVVALFNEDHWKDVACEPDYAGHDRFFTATYEGPCLEN